MKISFCNFLLFIAITATAANAQFTAATNSPFPVGNGPYSVATGDFNGDGKVDVAIANFNDSTVTVLLGNGSGGFTPAPGSPFATGGTGPVSLAVADINGDGTPDIIISNFTSNTGTALIGNGMGGFTPGKTGVPLGPGPYGVVIADFDQDGVPDIAAANSGANNVTVLLQGTNGNGIGPAPGSPFTVGSAPFALVVGDFNGDGIPDLATANSGSNNVTVLLGNGSGGFGAGIPTPTGSQPMSLAVGDFNGDGKLDLAVANQGSTTVTILLGMGNGMFTQATGSPVSVGSSPHSIAVADFNGDGIPDLVVGTSTNNLMLYLGNGQGGFTASGTFGAGSIPASIAVADFNRDGQPDVAVADTSGNSLTVLLNSYSPLTPDPQSLTFYASTAGGSPPGIPVSIASIAGSTYSVAGNQAWLAALPASNATGGSSTVTVGINPAPLAGAAGTYSGKVRYTAPNYFGGVTAATLNLANPAGNLGSNGNFSVGPGSGPIAVATGDFNGDGIPDIVTANMNASNLTVLLGNGQGGFTQAGMISTEIVGPHSVAVADFNGDGKLDLAVANYNVGNVTILLGNGAGGFTATPSGPYNTDIKPISIAVGDFNHDGIPDLAIANFGGNDVTILLGEGFGEFTYGPGSPYIAGPGPFSVAVGDFNGDGIQDLVVTNVNGNNITVLLGNHSGGFSAAAGSPFGVGPSPTSVVVGDFNQDGKQDLAVTSNTNNNVTVLLGNGSAGFTAAPSSPFATGAGPISMVTGDFNGDGIQDLATSNGGSNNVTVLLGNGSGGFAPFPSGPFPVGSNPRFIATADFNGDGRPDLVTANMGNGTVTVLLGRVTGTTQQTILFGPLSSVTFGVAPFTVSATATSGLTVSFASASPGVCAVSGTTVTITAGGSCTIIASQPGNATYAAAPTVSQSFPVNPAPQTITFGAPNNQSAGVAPITIGATASSGLPVSFASTTQAVCTVSGTTVTIVALATGTCSITASQAGNASYQAATPVMQSFTVELPMIASIVNGADNTLTTLAPGEAAQIYGSYLTNGPAGPYATPFPFTANGVTITVNGRAAPIQLFNPQQINIQIPYETATGTATVVVTNNGAVSAGFMVSVAAAAPGLGLTVGNALPVVTNINSATSPVAPGATAIVGGTGIGAVSPPVGDGQFVPFSPPTTSVYPYSATVGGLNATVQFLGLQPGFVSDNAYAMIVIPGTLAAGSYPVILTVNGVASRAVTVYVGSNSPSVSSVTPNAATTGSSPVVTIAGTNFAAGDTVQLTQGAVTTTISPTQVTSTQITATIPAYALTTPGAATISVTTPLGATSNAVVFSIAQGLGQTIAFDAITNQILGISPFPIAAEASSHLPVGLVSSTPAVCRLADDILTLVSAGVCSITASQTGNVTYGAAPPVVRSFTVALAQVSGSFIPALGSPFAVGQSTHGEVVGDFNGDGIPDLAVGNFSDNTVTLLLGNGSGGFTPSAGSPFAVGTNPQTLAAGDFNGDGNLDLAITNTGSNTLTVLLGNGAGGFTQAAGSPITTGGNPQGLAVGDFNGDGIQDLAIANETNGNVMVLLGNGSGGFTPAAGSPFATGSEPRWVVVADFNGDGIPDIATPNFGSNNVTVLLGNGSGGFSQSAGSPFATAGTNPRMLAVGDFNGDGIPDIVAENSASNNVTILLGNGSGGFTKTPASPIAVGSGVDSIVVGDFNGDGIQDLATTNGNDNTITILLGNGSGGFTPAAVSPLPTGNSPHSAVVADFNRDGILDIAEGNQNDNTVTVLLGAVAGRTSQTITFGQPGSVNYGVAPVTIFATASSGLTVSFASTNSVVCTVAGNSVTIVGAGTCSILASQPGNATYAAAPTVLQSFTVNPASQTILFPKLGNVSLGVAPFTISATASSGLPVSFTSFTPSVCTVSGSTVTVLAADTCTIVASQTGNANYNNASVAQSFTVLPGVSASEVGIFRTGNQWLLDLNNDRVFEGPPQDIYYINFIVPQAGDLPVVGDWSGSGTTKIGIYRPSTGQWFLDYNGDGVFDAGDRTYQFGGLAGDVPVVGDWSGSGTSKIGIFRSGFFWLLDYNGDGVFDNGDPAFAYGGVAGDVPVVGDWTGNGITKVGVVRPFVAGGTPAFWLLDANNDHTIDAGDLIFAFGGITGDVPVVGDWNGTGFAKAGVYRDGFYWVVDNNGSAPTVLGGSQVVAFAYGGIPGDIPVVGKW